MDCLVLPVTMLRRRCSGSRLGYRALSEDVSDSDDLVTVVVGKEKREFVVDSYVLEENPIRVLIDTLKKENKGRVGMVKSRQRVMMFVDVDAILFEHMLWLMMHNDSCSSSLLQINLKEIIDFYAQDY